MNAPDMGTDISPPIELSAGPSSLPHQHDPPFPYVLDGSCDSATAQPDIKPVLTRHQSLMNTHLPPHPHPHSHAHPLAGNLPGDMIGDFHFQAQDSGFYQGFTPGWSFPPG
jgi:hypothetical protein